MTVTNVEKDPDKLTMSITTELAADADRAWQMWSDPRLLEKWWGPPTYPATFVEHDFRPGGIVNYFMTGPEGDKHGGQWLMTAVEAPHRLEFESRFAEENGEPSPAMPVTMIRVDISDAEASDGVTRMTIESTFASPEAMEQLIEMGMDEGMALAMGQIDELL